MQDVCSDAEMVALLKQAKQGDTAAYDRLYTLYADKIFRYLYARLGQREVAEDLTADVFVRMLRTLSRFRVNGSRPVASFSAWLYTVAGNLAMDQFRKQKHRAHADIDTQFDLSDGQPALDRKLQTTEQTNTLMTAINTLVEEQRVVVLFRFAEGMSVPEVAQMMGKTAGAVKALQHRAVANLRKLLAKESLA